MFKSGVLYGQEAWDCLNHCKSKQAALPAVNITTSSTLNAALEAARQVNSPIIIQLSNGGACFYAGKGLDNTDQEAAVAGSVAAACHVHALAQAYGVPVILHTDHCARNLLPWIDGLLSAGEAYYEAHNRPLFSSHMLDLSEESVSENLATSKEFFERMHKIGMMIEIELGVTGGEEDGVDNTDIDSSKLYTQPEEVAEAYRVLSQVGEHFTIAAAFGNVHGVYKPGNVKLEPKILHNSQEFVRKEFGLSAEKPLNFVFHGGSGSSRDDIREALSYGAVKMNIDTDTQWAYWDGVRAYEAKNHDYLQGQIGNPDGEDKPNKKQYDPRVWVREAEKSFINRLVQAFEDLNAVGLNQS